LLREAYSLEGTLRPLAGENRNFLVETSDGRRFVLKIAGEDRTTAILSLEHAVVEHLVAAGVALALPRTEKTTSGAIEARWTGPNDDALRARLLAYVPGTPWCEIEQSSAALLREFGAALARVDLALADFRHEAAGRTHQWDLARAGQHRGKVVLISTAERRRLADEMFQRWAGCAFPCLAALPHSLIYGDANDENVLVEAGRVTGFLDFGDTLANPTICDLAIAVTYAMLDRPDPLSTGAEIVAGYHGTRPLDARELDALFPLICGRLAASVTIAAQRRRLDPDHPNWFVTEDRAWRLIEVLAAIDPRAAQRRLTALLDESTHRGSPREESKDTRALLDDRRALIGPSLSVSYREPLHIVRGAGQYLYDAAGSPYLDLVNNVAHVGHCHPRVVRAGQEQMARLNTNTRYLFEELSDYAGRLAATLPAPLEVCFFVNSGSEANELALRLARAHTRRRDVLVVDGAYHGNTTTLVAMSPYKFMGSGGSCIAEPWVHIVPAPDGYRGPHRGHGRATGEAYGHTVQRVIDSAAAPIAAFFVESLLSCAGQIVLPDGYLETAFAHVRHAGGVCVADEVQVGFGRVGSHFWGFELQHVVPDIVVMGKPIANGHPMGAVITTREIATSFANGMEFFSTFGGNPVSCAIGRAVLDVIADENLQAHALHTGNRMMAELRALMTHHPIVGDVRGSGLFIGVELVRDRHTLEPAATEASELINRLRARGILLSTDGPLHNVLKIKPPMVITDADVDTVVRALDDELSSLGSK